MLPNLTQSIKTVVLPRSASLLGCPGLYCGRTALPSGLLSECAACPKGHRPTMNSICDPCKDALTPYAWMYLAFMAILPLILQATVIDLIFRKWRKKIYVLLQICAVFEAFSAALTTVILFSGDEYLTIGFCGVDRVTDWYTLFRNPQPDYINTLQCTQEAVYPLYSMVFVYYFFSLLYMLSFRGVLLAKWTWSTMSRNALLAGLYQYPLLLAIHACCAGLLYFIFPHIVIIISSISCAIHCAVVPQQERGRGRGRGRVLKLLCDPIYFRKFNPAPEDMHSDSSSCSSDEVIDGLTKIRRWWAFAKVSWRRSTALR